MTHEWLTMEGIERIKLWGESDYDELDRILSDMLCVIADRREMHELLAETVQYLPVCTGIREDIEYMLEATDDPATDKYEVEMNEHEWLTDLTDD